MLWEKPPPPAPEPVAGPRVQAPGRTDLAGSGTTVPSDAELSPGPL